MRGSLRLGASTLAVACAGLLALFGGGTAGAANSQPTASGNGSISVNQSSSFGTRGALFSAEGRIQCRSGGQRPNTEFKGRINCALYSLNGVTISGNITDVSPATLPANTPTNFVAYAEDNGEPGQFIDRWSFFPFVATPTFNPTCLTFTLFGSPLTTGNIDVDPVVP